MAAVSNNCSTCLTLERQWELFPKFWGFFGEGILLAISNLLIVAAVAYHEQMRRRKEYVIVAGLALIDGINGIATGMAGIVRNIYILQGTANEPRSRWQCFWSPWIQLFHWADPLTCIMLLVVSIDRFLAVIKPLRYFKYTYRYALKLVGSAYLYTLLNIIVAGVMTYKHQDVIYPKLCMSGWSYDNLYYWWLIYTRLVTAGGSVFMYVLVVFFYKRGMAKVNPKGSKDKRQAAAQRKMTVTLGISSLFTLLLMFIPSMVEMFLAVDVKSIALIVSLTFIINNLNGIVNFFLYTIRHKEVRLAVKYMLLCKQMPPLDSLGTTSGKSNPKRSNATKKK